MDMFLNNPQIPSFMKILPLRAELFHAEGWNDGQTHRNTWRRWWSLFANLRTLLQL